MTESDFASCVQVSWNVNTHIGLGYLEEGCEYAVLKKKVGLRV